MPKHAAAGTTEGPARGSVLVVLNPVAGGGAGARLRGEVEQALATRRVSHRIALTAAPGDARELALQAARDGVQVVAAMGGDGTVHEVANGLLTASDGGRSPAPAMALIPVGTGNDFVKVVPGTATRTQAYDTLVHGEPRLMDAGRVRWEGGDEFFMNSMGTGIDVEVVRQIRDLPRLPAAVLYLTGLFRALRRFRPLAVQVTAGAVRLEQRIMILAVSNGRSIGGTFLISPEADPADGLFDVCVVDELNLAGIARVIPRVMRGTHAGHPKVRMLRASRVEVHLPAGGPLFFQLDGELFESTAAPGFSVELLPRALPVLARPPA